MDHPLRLVVSATSLLHHITSLVMEYSQTLGQSEPNVMDDRPSVGSSPRRDHRRKPGDRCRPSQHQRQPRREIRNRGGPALSAEGGGKRIQALNHSRTHREGMTGAPISSAAAPVSAVSARCRAPHSSRTAPRTSASPSRPKIANAMRHSSCGAAWSHSVLWGRGSETGLPAAVGGPTPGHGR